MIRSGRVSFHPALEPLMADIDSVHPAPWNYNNGDVDALAESIHRYGMYRPIQSQASTGDVIVGNHTWLACKEMGSTVIPLVPLEVDDTTARAIMVEDNEIARRAIRDRAQMLALVEQVVGVQDDYLVSVTQRDVEAILALEEMPLRLNEAKTWPTLTITAPPHLIAAYRHLTREADNETDALELLLRLAGWKEEA